MSMYNMLFGYDELAPTLMAALKIDPKDVGRYRDCYLNEDGSFIVVLTRTGGGNRAEYKEANRELAKHTLYADDEDDGFDSTYAYFYFNVPNDIAETCEESVAKGFGRKPAITRFRELTEKMATHPNDPDVKRALEAAKPLMDQLTSAFKDAENPDKDGPPVRIIEI